MINCCPIRRDLAHWNHMPLDESCIDSMLDVLLLGHPLEVRGYVIYFVPVLVVDNIFTVLLRTEYERNKAMHCDGFTVSLKRHVPRNFISVRDATAGSSLNSTEGRYPPGALKVQYLPPLLLFIRFFVIVCKHPSK